jgi:uncharacterized protein YjbI with pentapeptide repeats
MSRRQYRRNGTPIGDHKVYALAIFRGKKTRVYEIIPQGIETYEDLDFLVDMEELAFKFGSGYDRLVITKPGVDLSGEKLVGVDLHKSNLSGAKMSGSYVNGSLLTYCTLIGTDFSNAELRFAYLTGSNMTGADLFNSDVSSAEMYDVKLRDARTSHADFSEAYYPYGEVPAGFVRETTGRLRRR